MERRSFLKGVLSAVFGTVVPGGSALGQVVGLVGDVASGGVLKAAENIIRWKFGAYIKAYQDSGIDDENMNEFLINLLAGNSADELNQNQIINGFNIILPEHFIGYQAEIAEKSLLGRDFSWFLDGVICGEHGDIDNFNEFTGGVERKLLSTLIQSIGPNNLFIDTLKNSFESLKHNSFSNYSSIESLIQLKKKNLLNIPISIPELESIRDNPLSFLKIAEKESLVSGEQVNKLERQIRKRYTGDEEGRNFPKKNDVLDDRFEKVDKDQNQSTYNHRYPEDFSQVNADKYQKLYSKPSIVSKQELNQEQSVDLDKEQELDDFEGNPAFQRRFMKVESKSRRDF